MKLRYFNVAIVMVPLMLATTITFAQQRKPVRRSAYGNQQQAAPDTTQKNTAPPRSAYGGVGNQGMNNGTAPDTSKLPIVQGKNTSNGLLDTLKPSLRNDAAIDQNLVKERTPLEYENIREDDAVFRVRVWREIDTREKMNLPFRYAAVEDNGSQRFISILLQAIKGGQVTAFNGSDDRFTTPITSDDAFKAFSGGTVLSNHFDTAGNIDYKVQNTRQLDPDSITRFRLKEEWIFDKESSRMFVRILGIAPVVSQMRSDGVIIPGSEHAAWWVYYPDMRPVLAKYSVYNAKNYGARMTWEELFESRMFSSYIVKSTMDNPFDQTLADMYRDNTLFRLLEGDHIKDKIFDYEQSLWQY